MEVPFMPARLWLIPPVAVSILFILQQAEPTPACCVVSMPGKPAVNADQTVIIIWDKDTQTQHFIRQASFKSDGNDLGFLVPSPTQPELSESGNEAFPKLGKLTEPETIKRSQPLSLGCGCSTWSARNLSEPRPSGVNVLEEKRVAGFNASILEATSADALLKWLNEHGYSFSPEVQAWAKPYIDMGWKITAFSVAKEPGTEERQTVSAAALRMSFKTDRPLFPYREPDSKNQALALDAKKRLLRIYFIGEARYRGELTADQRWTGEVAWANKLSAADRASLLQMLGLPQTTGPAQWWLTEFEDNWPYRTAPADVTFVRDKDQSTVKRPPTVVYVSTSWPMDVMSIALASALIGPSLLRRARRSYRKTQIDIGGITKS
jgi:hypothetical protein